MTHEETVAHFQARSAQYRSEADHAANPDLANVYRLVADGLENVAIALGADRNTKTPPRWRKLTGRDAPLATPSTQP